MNFSSNTHLKLLFDIVLFCDLYFLVRPANSNACLVSPRFCTF